MGREVHGPSGNDDRTVGFRAREASATVFTDGPSEADRKVTRVAPVCSNCGASDFVWANELKTGGIGGGSLSLRSRGELSLGTRICRSCGHADLFLKDPSVLRMPHTWKPGEFTPITPKPAVATTHHPGHAGPAPPPSPAAAPAPATAPAPVPPVKSTPPPVPPSWVPSAAPSHHVAPGSPSVAHSASASSPPPATPPPPTPSSAPETPAPAPPPPVAPVPPPPEMSLPPPPPPETPAGAFETGKKSARRRGSKGKSGDS
jgi:hypothetical protein